MLKRLRDDSAYYDPQARPNPTNRAYRCGNTQQPQQAIPFILFRPGTFSEEVNDQESTYSGGYLTM